MNQITIQDSTINREGEDLFAKQETITRLLESIELSDYEINRIDHTYRIDPDRNGAVVILKDKKTERLLKATIDFKHGIPSWQQMMDLTFGIGEGSDIRIAVYDQTDSENKIGVRDEDEYMAGSFVSVLKASGLNAHLVRMTASLRKGRTPDIEFRPVPEEYLSETTLKNLPSRTEFEKAEFFVFYNDQLYPADPPISMQPDLWFGDIESLVSGSAITSALWNEQGIFLEAIFETFEDLEELRFLWNCKRGEILDHYKECEVRIEKGDNGVQKLVVKLSCVPFKDFVLSDLEGKQTLADLYLYGDREFVTFMGELLGEIRDNVESSDMKPLASGNVHQS
jgi:hypothetical protein